MTRLVARSRLQRQIGSWRQSARFCGKWLINGARARRAPTEGVCGARASAPVCALVSAMGTVRACVDGGWRKRRRLDGSDGTCTRQAAVGLAGVRFSNGSQFEEHLSPLPLCARAPALQVTFTEVRGHLSSLLPHLSAGWRWAEPAGEAKTCCSSGVRRARVCPDTSNRSLIVFLSEQVRCRWDHAHAQHHLCHLRLFFLFLTLN